MEDFTRVLKPGSVPHWREGQLPVKVYVKVEYKAGRLSITGVEGPTSNGNAVGGCGQIVDTLRRKDFEPTPGNGAFWLRNAQKLAIAWGRWHLNDMRPECSHQRALGWYDKAGVKVKLYHWRLDDAAQRAKDKAREAALKALEEGKPFTPTKARQEAATREYGLTTATPECPRHYGPRTSLYSGMAGPVEEKALGWLRPEEHPDGLLCRPCPECGYKYGSEWKREEVPESVLRFLYECPEAATAPAWV